MPIAPGEIGRRWMVQEIFDYEGLHLPNDTIIPFRFHRKSAPRGLELLPPIALGDLPALVLEYTDGGDILCEHKTDQYLVRGGERHGHGSSGFVALSLSSSPSALLWLAVLDWSEPFVAVKIVETEIEATSACDETWRFSIDPPYRVVAP
jgi:hypothetical protein